MSFLSKTPQVPQATATDGSPISTYREAEAVPIGFGADTFVSHWLSQPYDWNTAYGGQSKPEWQYCSIIAKYRDGPINYVGRVWRDNKLVFDLGHTFASGEESFTATLNPSMANGKAWKMIVHRGTADTPVSAVANVRAHTGQNHPPYRNFCWIEWINIDLGQGVTALPDLKVELRMDAPAIGSYAGGYSHPYGVNPFAAIYGLLRGESAFGLGGEYFEEAHWAAQCTALETIGVADRTGALVCCHPLVKTAQDASAILSGILANVDGFLYIEGGKFRIGWFPSKAPDVASLPELTEADIDAVPSNAKFPDWNRGADAAAVVFRDETRNFNDTPVICPAPANSETGVSSTPSRTDRPQIHATDQAALIAAEISASRASAESSVSLSVQRSRAVKADGSPLMPGDLFNWDYAPHSLDLVVRVVGRRMRSSGSDILEVVPERGQFPRPYVAPVDQRVLPTSLPPGEINVADVRLYLLPSGFGALRQLVPLVNRAHRGIYRVDLHLSQSGTAPWERILDSRFFAAKCALTNGGVGSAAGTVRVTSTSVDFARMAAQSALGQIDDSLLFLVDNELCSVGAVTAVAANTYDLAILRGRKGTTGAAHGDGSVGWLFVKSEISAAQHQEFYRVRDAGNAYSAAIATKHFKLQLFTLDEEGLAKPDDPGISLQLPDISPDESLGYTIVLSKEAMAVACAADGTVSPGQLGLGSAARTDVKVFRGATALTPVDAAPNSDQFSIAVTGNTSTASTKEDADSVRCDLLLADTGVIEITINVAGVFQVPKTFTLTKAKAGTVGASGPGLVYRGEYVIGQTYYHTPTRRDVVSKSGTYYLANNAAKSGLNTWSDPTVADWANFGAVFSSVATGLLLAEDATVTRTLTIGTQGQNHGLLRSANYVAGESGWALKDDGTAELLEALMRGELKAANGQILVGAFADFSSIPYILFPDSHALNGSSIAIRKYTTDAVVPNANWTRGEVLLCDVDQDANRSLIKGAFTRYRSDRIGWGYGDSGASDTWLYRASAGILKTDGVFSSALGLRTAGDIYLGENGTERWIYDGDGNRILRKRYAGTPSTLADAIAVLQHHGLCN